MSDGARRSLKVQQVSPDSTSTVLAASPRGWHSQLVRASHKTSFSVHCCIGWHLKWFRPAFDLPGLFWEGS